MRTRGFRRGIGALINTRFNEGGSGGIWTMPAQALAGTAGVWTPASATGVTLWMDPTRGFTANTSWVDQIGSKSFAYTAGGGTAVAGTSIGGAATVDLTSGGYFANASALSTIITSSAWWSFHVFRFTGVATDSADGYDNPGIIADTGGYWWKGTSTTRFHNGQYHGGSDDDTKTIVTATNYYVLCKYDGTNVYTSINGGAFSAGVAAGTVGALTGTLVVANRYNKTSSFVGSLGDTVVGNTALSAADAVNFPLWAHARYGI